MATNMSIKISLARNSDREIKTKQQLESLFKKYDLSKWFFTTSIRIEEGVNPFSHPVLTLSTYCLGNDSVLLSVFLHEQIHWFVDLRANEKEEVIAELKILFPEIPTGGTEGGKDEYSSYEHLIVNHLEYTALKQLIGDDKAREVIGNKDIYTELYKLVIQHYDKIQEILRKYNLTI